MNILPVSYPQNQYYVNSQNFKARADYTAKQICTELCGGACCNHGTPMSANLKIIADKICASYQKASNDLKSNMLIKAPIVKWLVNSSNPEAKTLNNLANQYIDAISRETNPKKNEELQKCLDELNAKLKQIIGEKEEFLAITNPLFKNNSEAVVTSGESNICMFKDHGKSNACTIYDGVIYEGVSQHKRPHACLAVGGEEMPCPWLEPEKYSEVYHKMKAQYERVGYRNIPQDVLQHHIAEQYNLNETWFEKIWKPYYETLNLN
jgi:hypothetical protein